MIESEDTELSEDQSGEPAIQNQSVILAVINQRNNKIEMNKTDQTALVQICKYNFPLFNNILAIMVADDLLLMYLMQDMPDDTFPLLSTRRAFL